MLAKILGVSQSVLTFFLPLMRDALASGLSTLLPLALDIVRDLATSNKSNSEKRDFAIDQLKKAAIANGISAGENLIRSTVEAAVANLKSK